MQEDDFEKNKEEQSNQNQTESSTNESTEQFLKDISPDKGIDESEEAEDKYSSVKSKISKILKSSNIEIIDENEGDEYEFENDRDKEKQQHDYDELKSIFGGNDKDKKQELTLSIDDYDYTYTGEYLDEYDLVHIKNIKKIKLQSKHSKLIKRIAIIASLIVVIGIAVTLSILLTRKPKVYLKSISLSKTEQTYYINEAFDYTGIYILAEYSDGRVERVKLSSEYFYDSQGYVERPNGNLVFTGGEASTLMFRYSGLETSIKINLIEKEVNGIRAEHTDGLFKIKAGEYLTYDDLLVFITYSNYEDELLNFSNRISIVIDGRELTYDSEHKGYEVTFDFETILTPSSYVRITYRENFEDDSAQYQTTIYYNN